MSRSRRRNRPPTERSGSPFWVRVLLAHSYFSSSNPEKVLVLRQLQCGQMEVRLTVCVCVFPSGAKEDCERSPARTKENQGAKTRKEEEGEGVQDEERPMIRPRLQGCVWVMVVTMATAFSAASCEGRTRRTVGGELQLQGWGRTHQLQSELISDRFTCNQATVPRRRSVVTDQ